MAITITKPTVGGSQDTWGETLNQALDTITDGVNGTTGDIAPNLTSGQWKVGGVAITSTGDEINVLDGNTNATSTTIVSSDAVVFNDGGTMKQVSMSDINTFIQASSGSVGNGTITISAGNALTGGGNFTANQSGATTVTLNHQDTSSQSSVNNSGTTVIQDVTLDGYGHVTGLTSATIPAAGSSGPSFDTVGSLAVGGPSTGSNGIHTHSAGTNYSGSNISFGNSTGSGTWKCISPSSRSNTYNYNDNPTTTINYIRPGLYERIS